MSKMSRRTFLKAGSFVLVGLALTPATELLGGNTVADPGNGYGLLTGRNEVSITITNLQPGDRVFLGKVEPGQEALSTIYNGLAEGSEVQILAEAGDDLPAEVVLRVRKVGFLAFETTIATNVAPTTLRVSRIRDFVYDE